MKNFSSFIFILLAALTLNAGTPSQAILDYIDEYKEIAINEMIAYHIPASITMAQGILESGAGQSELSKKSNNHFGIKCHTDWNGEKVYYDDDAKDECFRKYAHVEDSYRDHSEFLSSKTRYAGLFELDADDYKGWAKGLKDAGYATNPKYADMLINLIEEYELNKLDKMSLADAKKKIKKEPVASNDNNDIKKEPAKEDKKKKNKDENFTWGGYTNDVYYYNRIPTINIKAGDTPEQIASEHHIKIGLLRDYNDIENGGDLIPGTKFYLQPKRKNGTTKYHVVKSGETMWSISREEGVRLGYLYKYNLLEAGQEPAAGEQIYLRNKRKSAPKLLSKLEIKNAEIKKTKEEKIEAEPKQQPIFIEDDEEIIAPANTGIKEEKVIEEIKIPEVKEAVQQPLYHTVEAKETLYAISKKYGVTVAEIQSWNSINGTAISIGQQLIIGYK